MMSGFSTKDYVFIGLGVVGAYLLYRLATGGFAAAKKVVTEDLNPVSDKNLAYRATNAVTQAATGDKDTSLGSKVYDWFNAPNALRIDVITKGGEAVLANGTVLARGWRVEKDGSLYDAAGKYLGKAS